jgi:hypothetical protein
VDDAIDALGTAADAHVEADAFASRADAVAQAIAGLFGVSVPGAS